MFYNFDLPSCSLETNLAKYDMLSPLAITWPFVGHVNEAISRDMCILVDVDHPHLVIVNLHLNAQNANNCLTTI